MKILLMVILHVALALVMRNFEILAALHALLVFAIGFWTALTAQDIKKVIPIATYISGAEVLWRMTDANVFWEFGKYATIAILVIALLRNMKLKGWGLPLLFFIILVPSILLTVNAFGFSERTREFISFNLSGPLAVSVCILFFTQIEVKLSEVQEWIWAAVYPIISILTLAAYSTITATEINFINESMFVTSGGYGPNQVSAALGLGALLLVMWAMTKEGQGGRLLALLLALGLITQSFLTFSRGGVYNFAIGILAFLLHLLGKEGKFFRGVLVVLVIGIAIFAFIIPQLNAYTSGLLTQRYVGTDLASREALIEGDLQLFNRNPIFGVGPGMARFLRQSVDFSAAHTEYTRLLAEHGIFGILALLVLIGLVASSYFKSPNTTTRAWVVALVAWPLVEMAHSAMRVAGIAFFLGFAMVTWVQDDPGFKSIKEK
jgi:O-antigen ligase